jgi:excisionase family DNA binding protein
VARFCKVDLKTIHNWVDREQIRHFRTPGRHLRFRRQDVYEFLRKFDYPVPAELVPREPMVYVLEAGSGSSGGLKRQLGAGFSVRVFGDLLELLLKAGQEPPGAIVVDWASLDVDLHRLRRALQSEPATQTCRLVVMEPDDGTTALSTPLNADAIVPRSSVKELREALEKLFES